MSKHHHFELVEQMINKLINNMPAQITTSALSVRGQKIQVDKVYFWLQCVCIFYFFPNKRWWRLRLNEGLIPAVHDLTSNWEAVSFAMCSFAEFVLGINLEIYRFFPPSIGWLRSR